MNVKEKFLNWFFKQSTYKQVPATSIKRFIDEYVEWLGFDPFEIDEDFSNIDEIKEKIVSWSEELKQTNQDYVAFQLRSSRNAPAAILGKNNYFVFLDELRNEKQSDKLNLDAVIARPDVQSVINETEFYFQKGQDALKRWLDFPVSEELQNTLVSLAKNYKGIQELAAEREDVKEVLDLLFEVISYCDNHAKDKIVYNKYEDKRALADAFVRMNSWTEKIIQYRFLPDEVGAGSPKNAFDYLLDPIDNSTVLSENHRQQLSENFLKISYQPDNFEKDLEEYFKNYNLKTQNPQNYSHLLMMIVYSFQERWREKKATGTKTQFAEIIEQVKSTLWGETETENLFSFGKTYKDFVWIKDKYGIIGNTVAHYEIINRKNTVTVEVHFEGQRRKENIFRRSITTLPKKLSWFNWYNASNIKFNDEFNINDEDIVDKIIQGLIYIEENIGNQLRTIIKTMVDLPETEMQNTHLNLILFGPPGTGKTYKTVNKSLEIIKGRGFVEENDENREILIDEFNQLKEAGQIEFITFHQSFSYEDFVEGIKPVLDPDEKEEEGNAEIGDIKYKIRDGILKKMCSRAKGVSSGSKKEVDDINFDKASYFKMSVGGKQNPQIHDWCIENNKLALGWGRDHKYSSIKDLAGNWKQFRDEFKKKFPETAEENAFNIQAVNKFLKMKPGDIVLISIGNNIVDAIGIIEDDDYIFDDTQDFGYYQFRNIKWLATDLNASPELFVRKNLSQQSIYEFYDKDVKKENFKKEFLSTEKDNSEEKYVLIIDEINRGNVASIFGELISLIEPDKRIGADNELFARLPYSGGDGEYFGVPANLYIIGTMNTADRSIEALDTALRRRFSFEETPPVPELIAQKGNLAPDGMIDDVNVVQLLETINERIEKLIDKDHKIGHSYFMQIEKSIAGLKQVFHDKIIPLLEEYFFGDFGKIGLVLGSSFVGKVNNNNDFDFADFQEYGETRADLIQREIYRIKPPEDWDFVSIYTKKQEQ